MDRGIIGAKLFNDGYNCAQAVAAAFCDLTGLTQAQAAKMSAAFGGGMGRMGEVCGAVSGMLMVLSQLYGYETPDEQAKKDHYAVVRQLAEQVKEKRGSIVCREILKNPMTDPAPAPELEEIWNKRPCARMVYLATQILDDYIAANPIT